MEVDIPDVTKGKKDDDHELYPVLANVAGEGLPYAPINWPEPGDIWSWRTGKRIAASGHHLDRYLYLPKRLQISKRKKYGLASKQSAEQYVRSEFPNADVKSFFESFSWKIPSTSRKESSLNNSQDGDSSCKASNKVCTSLVMVNPSSELMACDICCEETSFCRDCCCILCSQTISSAHGGYSYFKCTAFVTDAICGHVAHINCSLKAYLTGTVGGSIGLDAEYYCRRCDSRSDLVPHVSKLLQTCKCITSRERVEEILGVGVCILRGSQRTCAKQLLRNISLSICKLKEGVELEEVWKMESIPVVTTGLFTSS